MKKHLLLTFSTTFLLFLFSSSQMLYKKDKLFGVAASLSFYNVTTPPATGDTRHYNNVAFMPSYAWVVKNDKVLGIRGNLSAAKETLTYTGEKTKNSSLYVGPEIFLKKYRKLSKDFGLYFNHGIYGFYSSTRNKNISGAFSKTNIWGGGYNFTPGAFYQFSDRFLGEANIGGLSLGYNKVDGGAETFLAGASFLTYFNIGIQYIIRKNRS
jgi:hypothetical protein